MIIDRGLWIVLISLIPGLSLAQYRDDWDYRTFYEELNVCRSSIMSSAAMAYEKRGLSAGQTTEQLRIDLIAITPAMEVVASATCYCAINELAKDITYASYKSDKNKIAGYVQGIKCKESAEHVMKSMSREHALELRLK